MDPLVLWNTILADLKTQISKAVYQTFFHQLTLLSFDGKKAEIGCRQPLLIPLIEKRYHSMIKATFDGYTKTDIEIVFAPVSLPAASNESEPLFTLPVSEEIPRKPTVRLNPDYTFENFAVSSSNQMAYAAATAVAQAPGVSYNPLFLYGGTGVGKTHLMQAIGHHVLKDKPKTKIMSCTGEEFTNEIIEAIGNKTTSVFKRKYRLVDMLLIDDVQFIAGKYSIQEEFFHTFNAIQQVKGQVVMTSDRPPDEIQKLEDRLRSRFEGGLTIDIGPPDFELRTAILMIKAKRRGVDIPIELAKTLSANVDNIRKLEGVLIRVLTESKTRGVPLDEQLVQSILGKVVKEAPSNHKTLSPEKIMNTVANYYQLSVTQLKSDKRDRVLSFPRQVLYYLLNIEIGLPLMDIGGMLGGRDHTTVLYGVRKVTSLLSTDDKIRADIMGIKSRLL